MGMQSGGQTHRSTRSRSESADAKAAGIKEIASYFDALRQGIQQLIPLMRAGKVFATLYQRPLAQGRLAFEAMHWYMVEGVRPKQVQKLPPLHRPAQQPRAVDRKLPPAGLGRK